MKVLRKLVARALVLTTVVVPSVAVFGSPAFAFYRTVGCSPYGAESQNIRFYADNGDMVSAVSWYWSFPGQGNAKFMFTIDDPAPYDGATTKLRVDTGSSVIEYHQDVDDAAGFYAIGYSVRKFRVVWNGHPTSWRLPNQCDLSEIDPN
ncbi:hypothetical protein [Actinoplanes utahensis]|uniref:Uncharacterized protein n=1 Tax=Actinoplanes utahensis TaxID=1869 RepID=A0A0A6UAE7_ACTUT|nr:hypothetical protein [Actinoplanes utahensis]KHD72033.1 hypothetical protein MB27_42785 [Actinoplanes utahensis]GIF31605.1 hypothetical protein Aut01nite_45910 [Actinoplanes utahensis]